jgi:hypothetical protein
VIWTMCWTSSNGSWSSMLLKGCVIVLAVSDSALVSCEGKGRESRWEREIPFQLVTRSRFGLAVLLVSTTEDYLRLLRDYQVRFSSSSSSCPL